MYDETSNTVHQTSNITAYPEPTTPPPVPAETNSNNEIKTDKEFSYDGYQVVRGTFFAHLFEPSVTFKSEKVYVNAACIRKLPTVDFVQFLVHPDKKMLAVKPCSEDTQDSFRWCSSSTVLSKRKAKAITCKIFFAKVMALMKWNPEYRYRIIGKLVCTPSDKIFVFDLTCAEAFRKKTTSDSHPSGNAPLYPESWMDSFGIPVNEHHSDFNLEIFDEDAVFTIEKEKEADHNSETSHSNNSDSPEQPNNTCNNIEKEVQT